MQYILTKKSLHTDTHKYCYGKDENYIPLSYFVYPGYNYNILVTQLTYTYHLFHVKFIGMWQAVHVGHI